MNSMISSVTHSHPFALPPELESLSDRPSKILVADDEPAILSLLQHQLSGEFEVLTAATIDSARRRLASEAIDIVLTDFTLPDGTGLQLLDWAYHRSPSTARVLMSGTARIQDAVDAINCGHVQRLILKPWRGEDLLSHLRDVDRSMRLERSHEQLLREMRRLNEDLEMRVQERTHELRAMNRVLEKMAHTDSLTGLPNRRSVEGVARQEMNRRERIPAPLAIGLIDADRFKEINSEYLHSGGDRALVALARTLQRTIRTTDFVGRVGGEEFLVVAPQTDLAGAEVLAERIRSEVADMIVPHHDQIIRVTVSLGFAVVETDGFTPFEKLRELAAEGLAEAKSAGRNAWVVREAVGETQEIGV